MAQLGIGWGLLQTGEPEAALAAVRKESSEVHRLLGLALIHHALGQAAEADAALAKLIEKHEQDSPAWIAFVLAFRGETDRSFVWLNKAAQNNDPELTTLIGGGFANIHDDPRWPPFLERIGKAPTQLATLEFEVIVPE